jgi:carbamoyltransferase
MRVLGLSCYYHDAAACLLVDGEIVAAAEEERFTRVKHDAGFPTNATRYCLAEGGIGTEGPDVVVFYDKPILKFHRILETHVAAAPVGLSSFVRAIPTWVRDKIWFDANLRAGLRRAGVSPPEQLHYTEHHEAHAASAFYASPFEDAAVVTLDGVGEWATATVSVGEGSTLRVLDELRFPHSLGLLYSAFTSYAGFKVNSGEYKLMGLAPYGQPVYADRILDELLHLADDGSFRLDMRYFGWLGGSAMTSPRFHALFGGPPRVPETPITQRECDLARSVQEVTEQIVLRVARHARARTGRSRLCLAGGVALNCVANGRLVRERIFDDVWIQPASGDSGGALGAALSWWYRSGKGARSVDGVRDAMFGSFLGPAFPDERIRAYLDREQLPYRTLDETRRADEIASLLERGLVVGVFDGRMEFGPRALGNRSILADPRSPEMQSRLNRLIKFRETFRPFAPAVLEERAHEYFELDGPSPYMLVVADVRESRRNEVDPAGDASPPEVRVREARSDIPAVTHVDYSARIQTVGADTNPRFHAILEAFERRTGCAVLVNTSFNVRGEPIVCTPEDAYGCFMNSGIDALVLGSMLLLREEQSAAAAPGGPVALD